jgi:hypothetical protein
MLRLLPLFSVKRYHLPDFRNIAGDYLPFTWLEDGEDISQVRGADIEMAKSLAQAMGVRAEFVKTTWPTLLDDLRVCIINTAKNDQAPASSYVPGNQVVFVCTCFQSLRFLIPLCSVLLLAARPLRQAVFIF